MGAIIRSSLVSIAVVATLLLFFKPISTSVIDHDEISNFNSPMLRRSLLQTTDQHQGYQYSTKDEDIKNEHVHERFIKNRRYCPNGKSSANRSRTMLFGVGSLMCFSILYGLFF